MKNREPAHWLLLRGLSRECRHWGAFKDLLQKAFPGDQFTCLDLPGCGSRHQESSPYTIGQMADFYQAKLQQVLEHKKLRIIAISMGGMVAWELLRRGVKPELLVLINTSMGHLSPFYHRLNLRQIIQIPRLMMASLNKREEIIFQMVSNNFTTQSKVFELWRQIQLSAPVSNRNMIRQLFAAARFRLAPEFQPHPDIRFLLLASEKDRLVSIQCSHAIHRRYGFDFHIHRAAGHDLTMDDPDWVLKSIKFKLS